MPFNTQEKKKLYDGEYYHKNKEQINMKRRNKYQEDKLKQLEKYQDKKGHVKFIWGAMKKYAERWKLSIIKEKEFIAWSMNDFNYETLYNTWVENGYSRYDNPVCMRSIKKLGFGNTENLNWWNMGNFNFFNIEDAKYVKQQEELMKEYFPQEEAKDAIIRSIAR